MKYFTPFVLFIVIAGLFWKGLQRDPHHLPSALLGQPVPEFSAPSLLDKKVVLTAKNFFGHVSLLNVWASWCTSCQAEHAVLMDIAASKSVPIYGLNYKDDPLAARKWIQQYGNPYQAILVDPEGKLAINFGVYGTPETFLIDSTGVIRYKHIGAITPEVWQQEIAPLVLKYKP